MVRRLLGMALVLSALAGCTKLLGRECQSDTECAESGQVCNDGYCFAANPPVVEPDACQPGCAATETCTTEGCRPNFTALEILSPTANALLGSGPVTVTAKLTRAINVATYPSTISLSVTPVGSGAETVLTGVTLNPADGTYSAQWTPPAGETEYEVKAAYAEAGLSATVRVRVDTVGPTFSVVLSGPTPQSPTGGFTYAQPNAPTAFRRDQTVVLKVQSAATDVNSATLRVTVRGVNGGPDLANIELTDCGQGPFCKQANVNLWEPGLNAFSGSFALEVEVRDLAGNAGTHTGETSIPVTRWRWALDMANFGDIRGTPAIGQSGTVYVGTYGGGTTGNVLAIAPEGLVKWQKALGAVGSSPAVGKPRGSDEYVYVGATGALATVGAQFYALRGSTGDTVAQCPGSTGGLGSALIGNPIAVGTTDSQAQNETAMGIYNQSTTAAVIVSIRPDVGTVSSTQCNSQQGSGVGNAVPPAAVGSSVLMRGENIFYATSASSSRLTSYPFFSITPRPGWPVSTTTIGRGLALLGDNVIGGAASAETVASGGLFTVPQSNPPSTVTFLYPSTTPNSRVFNLAIGSGNQAFFGTETGTASNFVRMDLGTPATRTLSSNTSVGSMQAAPVLGRNGLAYTLNTQGQVQAWATDTLSPRWDIALGGDPQFASPTLDCLRDGAGAQVPTSPVGVLYVPTATNLHAIIVDSAGLDKAAPWPKFQRDARNSGNPDTGDSTTCQ